VSSPETAAGTPYSRRHGNLQKHLNSNPVQQWLLSKFHRRVLDLISSTGARRILDVGCGEGFTMRELRRDGLVSGWGEAGMVGVDLSAAALAWNQDQQMACSPLMVADVRRLPFADSSFDLVLCLEVLEHLPVSALGLRELMRVTRSHVLVSVPHEPFFRGANFLRGKHLAALGNDPEHVHNFGGRAFRGLVSDHADVVWHGYSFPWQIALARKKG
jgi:SAM-dependent methyltransferase